MFVDVRLGNEARQLTFARTLVRMSPNALAEMRIDTDEANAAGIEEISEGSIVPELTAKLERSIA